MRGDKDIPIQEKHRVEVKDFAGQDIFCSLFLKNTDSGYEVYLLGKNGEPKPGVKVIR